MRQLSNEEIYTFGDFLIRPIDEHHISIKTNKGYMLIEPKAGNSVIIKSISPK